MLSGSYSCQVVTSSKGRSEANASVSYYLCANTANSASYSSHSWKDTDCVATQRLSCCQGHVLRRQGLIFVQEGGLIVKKDTSVLTHRDGLTLTSYFHIRQCSWHWGAHSERWVGPQMKEVASRPKLAWHAHFLCVCVCVCVSRDRSPLHIKSSDLSRQLNTRHASQPDPTSSAEQFDLHEMWLRQAECDSLNWFL